MVMPQRMPQINIIREIRRTWKGQSRNYTCFFGTKPTNVDFLREKISFRKKLEQCLKLPARNIDSVPPLLRSCLTSLNRLPFAFTWYSTSPLFKTKSFNGRYSRTPPKGKAFFQYQPPMVSVKIDGSKQSFEFWKGLQNLSKKYKLWCLSPPYPTPSFDLLAPVPRYNTQIISRKKTNLLIAEAKAFFADVEKLADEFLAMKQ